MSKFNSVKAYLKNAFHSKMIKNWSNLFLSMLVTSVCSFLCFAILGNKMTVDDYGLFSTLIALASTVSVFVNNVLAGIVANREIAIKPETARDLLKKFMLVRIFAFAAGCIALFIYTRNDADVTFILFAAVVVLLSFDSFWDLFEQIAFGLKVTKFSMLLNIVGALAWLAVVLLVPRSAASVELILSAYALICFVKTAIYGTVDVKLTDNFKNERAQIGYKYLLLSSLPYLYNRILGTISTQIPILLLDGYAGLTETAYFSIGEKFSTPVNKLVSVTVSAVFPFLTVELKKNHQKAGKLVISLFGIVLSFGGVLALLLCSTSDIWLVMMLGEKYTNAVTVFNYQVWYALVIAVDSVFSMALSSDFKQTTLSLVTTIDAVLLLPFLYLGVQGKSEGLALAKMLAALVCLIYHLVFISKIFSGKLFNKFLMMTGVFIAALITMSVLVSSRVILIGGCVIALIICLIINKQPVKELLSYRKKSKGG